MRLKPVEEQVVVLMGASSNIDHETALRFTEVSARVIVSARCEKRLTALVEEIQDNGGEAMTIPAEVSEFEQVKRVADGAVEAYRRFDQFESMRCGYESLSRTEKTGRD